MRSMLLLGLLLVTACDLFEPLGTDGPKMTGTWTVSFTYYYGSLPTYDIFGQLQHAGISVNCTGTTMATLKEDDYGEITGPNKGVIPCIGPSGGLELNMTLGPRIFGQRNGTSLDLHLGNDSSCWFMPGTMTSATTADGSINAQCGNSGASGTWSATRN